MTELKTIFQSIAELVEQLAEWEAKHDYMTKHHIISDQLVDHALIATNHCTFTLRENLYPVLMGEVLLDASTLRVANTLTEEILEIEQHAVKLDAATTSVQKAVYLYLLTLQASTLQSKAKLMLKLEARSRNRCVTVVVPRSQRTQSSFAL